MSALDDGIVVLGSVKRIIRLKSIKWVLTMASLLAEAQSCMQVDCMVHERMFSLESTSSWRGWSFSQTFGSLYLTSFFDKY